MLRRLLFGGESGLSPLANAGLALLRIFTGVSLMMAHGLGKIPPGQGLVDGAANLGFPAPGFFAWAAGLSETVGGALLALGLFTRVSSLFICITMLTAILGVHAADPYQRKELAFMYLFVALAHLIKGSGDWSIDAWFRDDPNKRSYSV